MSQGVLPVDVLARGVLTEAQPVAHDRDRERHLWEATAELLEHAGASRQLVGIARA